MFVLLVLNKIELEYTQNELAETIIKVAAGEFSFEGLLKWIIDHQIWF